MAKNSSNKTRIKLTTVSTGNLTEVTKRIHRLPQWTTNTAPSFLCNLEHLSCVYFKEHSVIQGTTQYKLTASTALLHCLLLKKAKPCRNTQRARTTLVVMWVYFDDLLLLTCEYRVNSHYFP